MSQQTENTKTTHSSTNTVQSRNGDTSIATTENRERGGSTKENRAAIPTIHNGGTAPQIPTVQKGQKTVSVTEPVSQGSSKGQTQSPQNTVNNGTSNHTTYSGGSGTRPQENSPSNSPSNSPRNHQSCHPSNRPINHTEIKPGEKTHSKESAFTEHSEYRQAENRDLEHFRDIRQQSQETRTQEKKIDHEYKKGRYDPAAANKKTKNSFYRKNNQGHGSMKWGDDHRKR